MQGAVGRTRHSRVPRPALVPALVGVGEAMSWEGIIGYMSWAACEHCKRSPMLEGGCDVDGADSAEVVDDWSIAMMQPWKWAS